MGTQPTKAADNIYCKCRKEAAKYNERLFSRDGAAELLGISVSSIADYELNNTKVVPVDKVVLMADLYNAPELLNHYCTYECPIGIRTVQKLEVEELDRLTVKILSLFRKNESIKDMLLDITEDGVIDDNEKPTLFEVIDALDGISKAAAELKLWVTKNLGE